MRTIFIIIPLLYALNTIIIISAPTTDAFTRTTFIGNETDRLALLDIKSKITLHPQGVLSSWNNSVHFCLWEGVTCYRRHRRVKELNLTAKGLVGTLSPFVGNLSFLRSLTLVSNTFKGLIPPQVGHLVRLNTLDLWSNKFEGEIPANISGCLQLTNLHLTRNNLVGNIPSELSLLSKLQILTLSLNSFTGKISPLSNLTSLQKLSLSIQTDQGGPGFQGKIPDFIGSFKDLTCLALGGNSFIGKIPPSLYNLSKLQILSLPGNLLEGSLSPNLGSHFPQLKWLQIQYNHFSGPIPFSLSNLSHLELIELDFNDFSGKFLLDGRYMKNLSMLTMDSAGILGTREADDLNFISTLVNCSQLLHLDIENNNFGSVLPQSIVNLSPTLRSLNVGHNQISGTIPSNWSNYQNLQALELSDNHLIGTIPTEIGQLPNLRLAYFSDNQLSGSIPLSLGNLSWLSILGLPFNKLQGSIPVTLGNCTNLQAIDLRGNNLVGYFPLQLLQASTLYGLYLSNNHLQGSLPSNFGELGDLVDLDMENNNFSGNIPSSLGQCLGLTYLRLSSNSFVGSIPQSFSQLKGLQWIELSDNKLSGQVPSYFSNFSSLFLLNLSFNNFEGEIPFGKLFSNLSAISLVGNSKLCGGIPELKLPRCPNTKSNKRERSHALIIIIAVSISCALVGLAIVSSIYLLRRRRRRKSSSSARVQFKEPFIKVSYDMILKATNGFSARHLIGSGSFGSVYKGTLLLDGVEKVVVVKVINNQRRGARKSFIAECKALRIIRHRNLVGVITACSSIDFQGNVFEALVYEFMPKGSLERWLYPNPEEEDQLQNLSLLQRLNIAIDVAHAVDYIHNGNDPPIIHCDLKPTNILLDEDMTARVGDFGLVKLLPEVSEQLHNSSSIGVRGTVGYAAPEYGLGTSVSAAGDVYSYGIILLEMMTAKNPTDIMFEGDMSLHKFAESALADRVLDIIDPKLTIDDDVDDELERNRNLNETRGVPECALECITTLIMTGARCSSELPRDRMDMKDVIRQLLSQRDHLLLCQRWHRCRHAF